MYTWAILVEVVHARAVLNRLGPGCLSKSSTHQRGGLEPLLLEGEVLHAQIDLGPRGAVGALRRLRRT